MTNHHEIALLIDVGSTWTKGVAVSLPEGRLLRRRQHPTTLAAGIMQGVNSVTAALSEGLSGSIAFRAATSSAAGGLRVAALGLVPDLTGIAARQASLGAGARVVFTGSYVLSLEEIENLRAEQPDIILLSGGTDGGNTEVVIENARRLAAAALSATVIFAGNKSARQTAVGLLTAAGYQVHVADNVLPTLDVLHIDSAQAVIRAVFLERITVARGIEELRLWASGGLLPTPRAVLEAASFLADGPGGFGTTVVVDIGGATTDVHSIGAVDPMPGVVLRGLPEPHAKRTVEGDLGLRVSAEAAVEALGAKVLAEMLGISQEDVRREAISRVASPATVRENDAFDQAVAVAAIAEAVNRHAGRLEQLPLRKGWVQTGKDLRRANVVIGSGGIFAARTDAGDLLTSALLVSGRQERLVPESADVLIDKDYVLFAVGLLAPAHPEAAGALARRSLERSGEMQARKNDAARAGASE